MKSRPRPISRTTPFVRVALPSTCSFLPSRVPDFLNESWRAFWKPDSQRLVHLVEWKIPEVGNVDPIGLGRSLTLSLRPVKKFRSTARSLRNRGGKHRSARKVECEMSLDTELPASYRARLRWLEFGCLGRRCHLANRHQSVHTSFPMMQVHLSEVDRR